MALHFFVVIVRIHPVKTTIILRTRQFRSSWSETILRVMILVDPNFLYVIKWKEARVIRKTAETMNKDEGAHQLSHV